MTITSEATEAARDISDLPHRWRVVRFGQMADSIADRVNNPSEAGVDYYIGLEHLDPDSLKIRRWGTPGDVEATKLRFKPGDIIFGRRRAYQRKLAVADFEGICSAHALVLRAREDVVLPDFLPFFMQSETFFQRAMAISVGSLSPTINWKTFAQQEFAIPPIDEQRRIAEILWAAEETCQNWEIALSLASTTFEVLLADTFDAAKLIEPSKVAEWSSVRLDAFAEVRTGLAKGKLYGNRAVLDLPYLRVANVQDGFLDLTEIKRIQVAADEVDRYKLRSGDVVLNEGGDFDKLGRGTVWHGEIDDCLHQNHVFCVRPNTAALLPEFLSYQTQSPHGKRYFLSCSKQTTNLASINAKQVRSFPLLITSLDEQHRIVRLLAEFESGMRSLREHLALARRLKTAASVSLLQIASVRRFNV